jgi:hypothetical protein
VLRVQVDGQFVPAASTVTDAAGNFEFHELPVGPETLYLPGANRTGVHYPGQRVRLTASHPQAMVGLEVCDTVAATNPLVIQRHEVVMMPEPGALHVTELLVIDNPTSTTYVGQARSKEEEPVTLRLNIPADFERVTFQKEFFGRNFRLADGGLVTGIPWTPGEREVAFTYTLRSEERQRVWQRPLDLPCRSLRVRVQHDKPEEVGCNLSACESPTKNEVAFASAEEMLPAGHVVRVELGRLPVPWTRIGRWSALGLLIAIVACGTVVLRKRPRRAAAQTPSPVENVPRPASRAKRRVVAHARSKRRRAA